MWALALDFAAGGCGCVYDWRVRRRRGRTDVDGFAARSARIRDEGRAGAPNDLREGYDHGST